MVPRGWHGLAHAHRTPTAAARPGPRLPPLTGDGTGLELWSRQEQRQTQQEHQQQRQRQEQQQRCSCPPQAVSPLLVVVHRCFVVPPSLARLLPSTAAPAPAKLVQRQERIPCVPALPFVDVDALPAQQQSTPSPVAVPLICAGPIPSWPHSCLDTRVSCCYYYYYY